MSAAETWTGFCARLAAAGAESLGAARLTASADSVDGAVQFGSLLEAALRWELRSGDADFPRFVEINDTPELADNLFAPVRGDACYRLTGQVASLFDFNVSIHTNWGWLGPSKTSGDLGRGDLDIDAEGGFELLLGGKQRARNWLPLPPDAAYVQIREYYPDYEPRRPGVFDIQRIGGEAPAPDRMSSRDLSERLERAAAWAGNYVAFHMRAQERLFPEAVNSLRPPAPVSGGNSHIWYGFGRFDLTPDSALILEFDKPDARVWGVQWLKAGWYENADLINRLTSLPGGEAHVDADGRVRVVIAQGDPGVANWLDTGGYPSGLFVTRWIWCEQGPPVRLNVVPLNQLRAHLPADTPAIAPVQRAAQRERRRRHLVHRRR